MVHSVPDIPGREEVNPDIIYYLQSHLSNLCGDDNARPRFPGSQPISFASEHLHLLETKDFWVCEKSDGLRLLLFVILNRNQGRQEVWLVDRKQRFFHVSSIPLPQRSPAKMPEAVIDGELIIDIDPRTKEETLCYYAFDCLAQGGQSVTDRPITKRYARLHEWVNSTGKSTEGLPSLQEVLPFSVVAKKQELGYHAEQVLKQVIPRQHHKSDGLIFTCAESPYVFGTDDNILKWKPASENSIDFKLHLRFPPSPYDPNTPDYTAKPAFLLYTWLGKQSYEFFDSMDVTDQAWEEMKRSGDQYDERIVECSWDTEKESWIIMRYRDDKPDANHKSVMGKILQSIQDGVEEDALLARREAIKSAWKIREAEAKRKTQATSTQVRYSDPPTAPGQLAHQAPAAAPGGLSGLRR